MLDPRHAMRPRTRRGAALSANTTERDAHRLRGGMPATAARTPGTSVGTPGAGAGWRLYSEETGTGPTVVFLPGLAGTTTYFRDRVAPLAADHRLVLVDLLGFGRSPKPDVRYDLARHVDALRRVLARRGPVTLVGHSLGARVAVAYAGRYPRAVERLVLLALPHDPGPHAARDRDVLTRGLWIRRRATALSCFVGRTLPEAILRRLAKHLPADIVHDARLHTGRAALSSLFDAVLDHDLGPDIDRVPARVPVTLVHGDRDTTAPLAGARAVVARRPGWRLVILPGVDHHPLLREPATVASLVTAHVRPAAPAA
jgi:pimeloyl-ACP methyl ester carboxylesterase